MKIKKLAVKGFMRFKEQQSIDFPANIVTLVFGENGAGKTSLLDAICVCLYGRTFRTVFDGETGFLNIADLVNHDSTKASIHLEFENHDHNYVVRREIDKNKSNGELLEDGEVKAEGNGVYDYVSSRAIGLDWDGFIRSTVVLQGEMGALTDVLPATRKEAFVRLFGLAKYGKYENAVSRESQQNTLSMQKLEAANEVLKNETAKIPQVESSLKRLGKSMAALEHQKNSSARKIQQIENLLKRLERDHRNYLLLNGKLDGMNSDIDELEKTLDKREREFDELSALKNGFIQLQKKYKEFTDLTQTLKKLGRSKPTYDKAARRIMPLENTLNGRKQKLAELSRETEASKALLAKLKRDVSSAGGAAEKVEEMAGLERQKNELERKLYMLEALITVTGDSVSKLREEATRARKKRACPVCMQQVANAGALKRHYAEEMDVLSSERRKKERERAAVAAKLGKIERKMRSMGAALERASSASASQKQMLLEIKKLDTLRSKKVKLRKEIMVLQRELEKQRRSLKSLGFDPRLYEEVQKRIASMREEKVPERYSGTGAQLSRLADVERSAGKAGLQLASLKKQRTQLLVKIKKFRDIEHRFSVVKEELDAEENAHKQNLVAFTKEKTNHDALAKQYAELKKKEKKLQQNEDEIEELRDSLSSLDELVKIFKEIPQNILHRLVPYIEKEGTAIISDLSGGTITALNVEKGTLNIGATTGGEARPIQYFSGGQQTRINTALRVAISKILSSAAQTGDALAAMQTLIIDEGDFGNLDEMGVRDAVNMLQGLRKDFSRIVLVSHMESVRSNFRGHVLEVNKAGPSESTVVVPSLAVGEEAV